MSGISVTIVGREEILARFRSLASRVPNVVRARMLLEMSKTAEFIRAEKLSGQLVKNRTGTLRRSIHPDAEASGSTITGIVGTNVEYAKYLERGTAAHEITPKSAKVLAFKKGGEMVFARHVNHPGIQARRFLAGSIEERTSAIVAGLRESVLQTVKP